MRCTLHQNRTTLAVLMFASLWFCATEPVQSAPKPATGDKKPPASQPEITYPPQLSGGQAIVTDTSLEFLKAPDTLQPDVAVAKTPPTIDFLYYPGQSYPGRPWSNWGDSLAVNGKYYASIGDHLAVDRLSPDGNPQNTGTGLVFEYDPKTRRVRQLVDVKKLLDLPLGHYTPGKLHGRLDMGRNGWLYFCTYRGSYYGITKENPYHDQGDWILRVHPDSGKAEVVARGPLPGHGLPTSVLDPKRLIFYAGTMDARPRLRDTKDSDIHFLAYDLEAKKVLHSGPIGPARYLLFAESTGKVYFVPGKGDGPLMRYDPETGKAPVEVKGSHIGIRVATRETPQGFVYTVSNRKGGQAHLWSFNTKTEEIKDLGLAAVGSQDYVASIDADPSGRYLYYMPGAHGSSDVDGTPVVQFDVKTGKKKVIAFLHPFYQDKYGFTLKGTYSSAVNAEGDTLYVTWNVSRGGKVWDCCGLTVIHIPESER